jgi:hypothetical protein
MDQEAILKLLGSFYDKLVTDVSERVIDRLVRDGALTTEVDSRIEVHLEGFSDHLAMLDKTEIKRIVDDALEAADLTETIDARVTNWMSDNFDITDYESDITDMVDVREAVDEHLADTLKDAVQDCVSQLEFTVTVSNRF